MTLQRVDSFPINTAFLRRWAKGLFCFIEASFTSTISVLASAFLSTDV
jgi:hypothetical protein